MTSPKNAHLAATLTVYRTRSLRRSQRWAWRLTTPNGRIIATSGEGYSDRNEARVRGRLCDRTATTYVREPS